MKKNCQKESCVALEKSCQAVFVCESCHGSTKSTKYRHFDGANYSTQLHFSVHTKAFYLQSKLREESRKTFFLSIYDVTYNLWWICSCCEIMMKNFQNSIKMSHFRICGQVLTAVQLASLIFCFSFREKQIMCRNICSHLTIFPLTHLITSFNESRKNLTDKPKFQKTFLIRTFMKQRL